MSRRDFWRILYAMLKEGVTIFVSTAYLDEAERCSRVGLMHRGRLIQCDTPQQLKLGIGGQLLELETERPRAAREALATEFGGQRVSLFGGTLHVHADDDADAEVALRILAQAGFAVHSKKRITPSLEDAFIRYVGEDEAQG